MVTRENMHGRDELRGLDSYLTREQPDQGEPEEQLSEADELDTLLDQQAQEGWVDDPINPRTAAFRKLGLHKYATEDTRHHWRKIWKRNGGRKICTLRTHRVGR